MSKRHLARIVLAGSAATLVTLVLVTVLVCWLLGPLTMGAVGVGLTIAGVLAVALALFGAMDAFCYEDAYVMHMAGTPGFCPGQSEDHKVLLTDHRLALAVGFGGLLAIVAGLTLASRAF